MLLRDLVELSARVAATPARSDKVALLASLLRRLDTREIAIAVPYLTGDLRQGKIGVGWAAQRDARGAAQPARRAAHDRVAVDAAFAAIADCRGRGSAAEKARLLAALFAGATEPEGELLGRLVLGELRQGALAGLLTDAVAVAAGVPDATIRRAAMLAGELAVVAEAALVGGREALRRFSLEIFRPLQPMLAQPVGDAYEALDRLGEAAFEWKLDGARIQAHRDGDEVRVFSRRLREVTAAVPEVVEAVRSLPCRQVILDGEVLALRPDGSPQPFQVTMRRFGRKLDVAAQRQALPLTPVFFDILHCDGDDALDAVAAERAALLEAVLPVVLRVERLVTGDRRAAATFLAGALERGHEGVVAKALDAPYAAGARGSAWLKIKPAHTLDLVVLAAEWGHGRRRGWLSNLHLGAQDAASGQFAMLGKTFKGMTDAMLAWQTEKLQELAVERLSWGVRVRPELVVEVAFNEVQESPQYPSGMALRFARVKRYRTDKRAADADTLDRVRALMPPSADG